MEKNKRKPEPHLSYQAFQSLYGLIPASDLRDQHILKSRMLQGIYRGPKVDGVYCNMVDPSIKDAMINFMRHEKLASDSNSELKEIKSRNRLSDEGRLTGNLLSSQPLAFNLFLPLKWDNYQTATKVFQLLFPDLGIATITMIKLEYVPGDESPSTRKKIDGSCFDVYVEYLDSGNKKAGLGFEVKYTESFSATNFNNYRDDEWEKMRYLRAIKDYEFQFQNEHEKQYLGPEFNQLFRNQLLAHLALENDAELGSCIQIVLHSAHDTKCVAAIKGFEKLLLDKQAFRTMTIENFLEAINSVAADGEVLRLYAQIYDRYCNYGLVAEFLKD